MKKSIILLITVVLLICGSIFGYRNVNAKYPAANVKEAKVGENLEYQKGILISADKKEILSDEAADKIYEMLGEEPVFDTRIFDITITLSNTTEEPQEVVLTDIYLETTGAANGIALSMTDSKSGYYDSPRVTLAAGEEKQVTFPYTMSRSFFSQNEWKDIEKRQFWLTFSSYPVKTILRLE